VRENFNRPLNRHLEPLPMEKSTMANQPRISVVIPAYNAEHTIARTLDSVLAQTRPVDEVIVIDDGSRDGTTALVSSYASAVRCISQPNAGVAAARNQGIQIARGDWIAFLDADDAWLPEKIERQIPELRPGVDVVNTYVVDQLNVYDKEITFESLWIHNRIGTSTVIARKSTLLEAEGFVEDRRLMSVEDYNLWLRLAGSGKTFTTVREPLTLYTPAAGNLSSQLQRVIQAELFNLELIAGQFHLTESDIAAKRANIYEEYARSYFWMREMLQARQCYAEVLRDRPTLKAALYWAATFVPPFLLNVRRLESRQPPSVEATSSTISSIPLAASR
jgi:hypothetical protein